MPAREKKYYKIGQVSKILGIEPHVLRFWESQFSQIRPKRVAKHRLYRKKDLKTLKRIKELLYNEGYTIAGAKKKLLEEYRSQNLKSPVSKDEILQDIKKELLEIKKILGG